MLDRLNNFQGGKVLFNPRSSPPNLPSDLQRCRKLAIIDHPLKRLLVDDEHGGDLLSSQKIRRSGWRVFHVGLSVVNGRVVPSRSLVQGGAGDYVRQFNGQLAIIVNDPLQRRP